MKKSFLIFLTLILTSCHLFCYKQKAPEINVPGWSLLFRHGFSIKLRNNVFSVSTEGNIISITVPTEYSPTPITFQQNINRINQIEEFPLSSILDPEEKIIHWTVPYNKVNLMIVSTQKGSSYSIKVLSKKNNQWYIRNSITTDKDVSRIKPAISYWNGSIAIAYQENNKIMHAILGHENTPINPIENSDSKNYKSLFISHKNETEVYLFRISDNNIDINSASFLTTTSIIKSIQGMFNIYPDERNKLWIISKKSPEESDINSLKSESLPVVEYSNLLSIEGYDIQIQKNSQGLYFISFKNPENNFLKMVVTKDFKNLSPLGKIDVVENEVGNYYLSIVNDKPVLTYELPKEEHIYSIIYGLDHPLAPSEPLKTPKAVLSIPTTAKVNFPFRLSGADSKGSIPLTYIWSITPEDPSHKYILENPHNSMPMFTAKNQGLYNVTLKVSDGIRKSTSETKTISIQDKTADYIDININAAIDHLKILPEWNNLDHSQPLTFSIRQDNKILSSSRSIIRPHDNWIHNSVTINAPTVLPAENKITLRISDSKNDFFESNKFDIFEFITNLSPTIGYHDRMILDLDMKYSGTAFSKGVLIWSYNKTPSMSLTLKITLPSNIFQNSYFISEYKPLKISLKDIKDNILVPEKPFNGQNFTFEWNLQDYDQAKGNRLEQLTVLIKNSLNDSISFTTKDIFDIPAGIHTGTHTLVYQENRIDTTYQSGGKAPTYLSNITINNIQGFNSTELVNSGKLAIITTAQEGIRFYLLDFNSKNMIDKNILITKNSGKPSISIIFQNEFLVASQLQDEISVWRSDNGNIWSEYPHKIPLSGTFLLPNNAVEIFSHPTSQKATHLYILVLSTEQNQSFTATINNFSPLESQRKFEITTQISGSLRRVYTHLKHSPVIMDENKIIKYTYDEKSKTLQPLTQSIFNIPQNSLFDIKNITPEISIGIYTSDNSEIVPIKINHDRGGLNPRIEDIPHTDIKKQFFPKNIQPYIIARSSYENNRGDRTISINESEQNIHMYWIQANTKYVMGAKISRNSFINKQQLWRFLGKISPNNVTVKEIQTKVVRVGTEEKIVLLMLGTDNKLYIHLEQ